MGIEERLAEELLCARLHFGRAKEYGLGDGLHQLGAVVALALGDQLDQAEGYTVVLGIRWDAAAHVLSGFRMHRVGGEAAVPRP